MTLPKPDYRETLNYSDGTNADIIDTVHQNFPRAVEQTIQFAQQFTGNNARETAHNIWKFLKQHITYKRDPAEKQLIRLPSRFIRDQEGDCKSYALTAAALLANNNLPVAFRYANYRGGTIPSHIYAVTRDENGKEIIVDGVWKYFDSEKPAAYKFDRIMKVYTLSGIDGPRPGAIFRRMRNSRRRALMELRRRDPKRYARLVQQMRNRLHRHDRLMSKRYVGTLDEMMSGIDSDYQDIGKIRLGKFFKKFGNRISKIAKGAFKGLKKIGLAIPRRSFRTMVALNIGGMALKLKRVFDRDPAAIKKKWESVGGKVSELRKSVKAGYNRWAKKHHKGPMTGIYGCDVPELYSEAVRMGLCGPDDSIGFAPAAIAAAAAPIIAALKDLLKKHEDPNAPEGQETSVDSIANMATEAVEKYNSSVPEGGEKMSADDPTDHESKSDFDAQPGESDTPAVESSFEINPLLLGGAGLALFLLMKK
jgi:hypothetical protein